MFGLFGKKSDGWRKIRGEAFAVQMPSKPQYSTGQVEFPRGQLCNKSWVAVAADATSCHMVIRFGAAVDRSSTTELFQEWREEFLNMMRDNGIPMTVRHEKWLGGRNCDYSFERAEANVHCFARLLHETDRLVIMVCIGKAAAVERDHQRFFDSYVRR